MTSTAPSSTTRKGMMSDIDLREFYRRYVEALNAHDFDRMDEFIHDQIMQNSEPRVRSDVVADLTEIVDAVPDFHWEVTELAVNAEGLERPLAE
jgi:predicted ester cyclase